MTNSRKGVTAGACAMLLWQGDQLCFVRRSNTGFMDGYLSLPAGRLEDGEAYKTAAIREAEEEAGIVVDPAQAKHVFTLYRESHDAGEWTDIYFMTETWEGEAYNAAPSEHSELIWLPAADLPDDVLPYQRYAIDHILGGGTYGQCNTDGIEI